MVRNPVVGRQYQVKVTKEQHRRYGVSEEFHNCKMFYRHKGEGTDYDSHSMGMTKGGGHSQWILRECLYEISTIPKCLTELAK